MRETPFALFILSLSFSLFSGLSSKVSTSTLKSDLPSTSFRLSAEEGLYFPLAHTVEITFIWLFSSFALTHMTIDGFGFGRIEDGIHFSLGLFDSSLFLSLGVHASPSFGLEASSNIENPDKLDSRTLG